MLFPCPPSSSYTLPSSGLMNNGQSSNAFLGLKPSNNDNMDHLHHHDDDDDDDEDRVKGDDQASVKKKGEKKAKKPKYAFQTRSQVDILDDGYRWRKYGQKAVKNNKFPRFLFLLSSSIYLFFLCFFLIFNFSGSLLFIFIIIIITTTTCFLYARLLSLTRYIINYFTYKIVQRRPMTINFCVVIFKKIYNLV